MLHSARQSGATEAPCPSAYGLHLSHFSFHSFWQLAETSSVCDGASDKDTQPGPATD